MSEFAPVYPVNSDCITVRQLKELIRDWPEKNECGDDCEVWIGSADGLSNPCSAIMPLNVRMGDNPPSADIIFEVE